MERGSDDLRALLSLVQGSMQPESGWLDLLACRRGLARGNPLVEVPLIHLQQQCIFILFLLYAKAKSALLKVAYATFPLQSHPSRVRDCASDNIYPFLPWDMLKKK
jgi:hypothetical protein